MSVDRLQGQGQSQGGRLWPALAERAPGLCAGVGADGRQGGDGGEHQPLVRALLARHGRAAPHQAGHGGRGGDAAGPAPAPVGAAAPCASAAHLRSGSAHVGPRLVLRTPRRAMPLVHGTLFFRAVPRAALEGQADQSCSRGTGSAELLLRDGLSLAAVEGRAELSCCRGTG